MTAGERGFLLLTGYLGDPERKPLTTAQFRELTKRARAMERPNLDREMNPEDLIALGYGRTEALRILLLLSQEEQLQWYVGRGRKRGCTSVTRISPDYPEILRQRLGMEAPGALWLKGNPNLLREPAVSLVGSRDLHPENLEFAREVGRQAALQGKVLVSGNARGADRTAQDSCLQHGGKVVVVVADELEKHTPHENVLYISEEGYELKFSAPRALNRNRIIHCLGSCTLVAQCTYKKGGTWDGTGKNLRHGWSPVFCFRDGSPSSLELADMGAALIGPEALSDLDGLQPEIPKLI